MIKFLKTSLYFEEILSITLTTFVLIFYFYSAYVLGYFPTYDHPDPKVLSFYPSDSSASIIIFVLLYWEVYMMISFPVWILFVLAVVFLRKGRIFLKPSIVSIAGRVIGLIVGLLGIFEWYID